jgi:RimJ/RimL family protein N-acetyltransferase
MRGNYFLKSARLGFRRWIAGDEALAQAIWGDPEVTRFVGGPFSPEQVRERLEREIANMEQRGVQYWPIFLLESGEHAGCAGLRPHGDDPRVLETGYYLRPEYWGMGLAQEAGRTVAEYAFAMLGVHTLVAAHHPQNASSQRVLERLGFRRNGEKLYPPTGLMHPEYVLELSPSRLSGYEKPHDARG